MDFMRKMLKGFLRKKCKRCVGGILFFAAVAMLVGCAGIADNPKNIMPDQGGMLSAESSFEDPEDSIVKDATATPNPAENEIQDSYMEVHFIDVGQADAALVLCDGDAMLIDGGNAEDSNLLYTYLKKREISHLDYMIATHGHEDHVGGLAGALNYADVDTVYCPVTTYDSKAFSNFKTHVEKWDARIEVPSPGDSFALGSAQVEILGLNAGDGSEVNDTSIILKITHGEVSFLFTGDAEREAEEAVVDGGYDLSSTVLKVGHHGSADSTTYPFLREIMPAYAVISVGKDNTYGHPTEEALSRLRDAGVKVFRTDLQGDIIAVSDTQNVSFHVARNLDAVEREPEITVVPAKKTYVLNTNTMKFHVPTCNHAEKIADENYLEYVGTAAELEAMEYVGCKVCNPN